MLPTLLRRVTPGDPPVATSSARAAALAGRDVFDNEIHERIESDLAEFGEVIDTTGSIAHTRRHGIILQDLTAILKHPHLRLTMRVKVSWNPRSGELTYTNENGKNIPLAPQKWAPEDLPTDEDLELIDAVMERIENHPVWSTLSEEVTKRVPDARPKTISKKKPSTDIAAGEAVTPQPLPGQPLTTSPLGSVLLQAPASFYFGTGAFLPVAAELTVVDFAPGGISVAAAGLALTGGALYGVLQLWQSRAIAAGRAPLKPVFSHQSSTHPGRTLSSVDKVAAAGALGSKADKSQRDKMLLQGANHIIKQWNHDLEFSFQSLFESGGEQEDFLDAFLTLCEARGVEYHGDLQVCPAPERKTLADDPHAPTEQEEGGRKMPYASYETDQVGTALLLFTGSIENDHCRAEKIFFDGRRFYRPYIVSGLCPIA